MLRVKRLCIMFLTALFIVAVSCAALSAANREEMFLTGIVTNVNVGAKQVVVDLQNKGCRGIRTFNVMKSDSIKLFPGKNIQFFIDSEYCPGPEVRRITKLWGVK